MRKTIVPILLILTCTALVQAGTRGQLRQGGQFYNQEKYGSALNVYQNILKKDPENQFALFNAANAYYRLNEYTQAEELYKKTSQTKGGYAQSALYNLGNTYYHAGDKEQAKSAFIEALLKDPQDKEAAHNLQVIIKENQQNQQNQSQHNQDNQDNKSDNQQDQPNNNQNQGQNQDQQNQQNQKQSGQLNKQDADRVMSMAKENEFKHGMSSGNSQDQTVEKDW